MLHEVVTLKPSDGSCPFRRMPEISHFPPCEDMGRRQPPSGCSARHSFAWTNHVGARTLDAPVSRTVSSAILLISLLYVHYFVMTPWDDENIQWLKCWLGVRGSKYSFFYHQGPTSVWLQPCSLKAVLCWKLKIPSGWICEALVSTSLSSAR